MAKHRFCDGVRMTETNQWAYLSADRGGISDYGCCKYTAIYRCTKDAEKFFVCGVHRQKLIREGWKAIRLGALKSFKTRSK